MKDNPDKTRDDPAPDDPAQDDPAPDGPAQDDPAPGLAREAGLEAILLAVRDATRHDFHCYKRATLERRIRRRMVLHRLGDYGEYARLLQGNRDEAITLRQDLLIGITEFFRQPEAWRTLDEKIITGLVQNSPADSTLRAWVPACATGKEAYSLAMLLVERAEGSGRALPIQVFATDADAAAIERARIGRYDELEMGGVSPERMQRFFVHKDGRYEVAKHLRELIVFAPHDLTSDPPFSRVDLISCRNLLIYLDAPQQRRIMRVFHFALREGGGLFLGSAESIGGQDHLFEPVSRKHRIFRKLPTAASAMMDLPVRRAGWPDTAHVPLGIGTKPTLSVLAHKAIADRFGPAAAIVDRRGTVLYLHGEVEPFLQIPSGPQTGQLQDAAREGLRNRLVPALLQAADGHEDVTVMARMRRNGRSVPVKVTVSPLRQTSEADGLLLVSFEKQRVSRPARQAAESDQLHTDTPRLEEELRLTREELSGTVEQLRHSNEYLRAANEEATSSNEELQSINEELETSREELQSLNEELNVVNQRLQENVTELQEATRALRASEAKALWLARFPDENPNPVARVSEDGTVLYRNPAAAHHPGWRCEIGEPLPPESLRRLVDQALDESRSIDQDVDLAGTSFAVAVVPMLAEGYANLYGRDVSERRKAQEALEQSELRVRRKLESVLSPEGDLGTLDLADLIDVRGVQKLMDDFYAVAGIPMSVVDVRGRVLVGVGWQDICTRFHRVHPETSRHCLESDTRLASGLAQGESRLYKCRNNLWDMATPIMVSGQHVGNIFTGQFFFNDETVDREEFRAQARKYGLDEAEYLAALDRVPRLDHRDVERGMRFFLKLADMLSQLGYSNVKLARLLEERDRLTNSLRESEDRLKRAQEIAHLGSWELDLLSNKLTWSDEVFRIFGLEPQEFGATYDAFLDHIHPEDRFAVDAAYSDSLREGRHTYEIEHRVVRSGTSEVRFVHEKCEHLRDASGRIVRSVGMVHDITERKHSDEELRRSRAELESRVEERTREVGALANSLRALATELTQAEQRERLRLAQTLHDHLQQLLVAAQMQLSLIPRADAKSIQMTVCSVDAIIRDALAASRSLTVELCPPVLHQSGLVAALSWLATNMEEKQQFRVHLRATNDAEPASPEVRAFLFDAVRELLLNSVKHSSVREASLAMLRTPDDRCTIVLEDEGCGFDPAALRPGTSGGFGLFSIQQRLLHLGGTLEIESAPGRGTKAFLSIPVGRSSEAVPSSCEAIDGAGGQVHVHEKGPKIRVLLVDDHQIMRQGLTSLLQFENDIEIVGEAENGEQAVALARRHLPDVVIMDVNMPGMDGISATRVLATEMPQTRVIGLSMHLDHDAANAMREAGAVAYITKGGNSEDMIAAIRACGMLERKRPDAP
jgi:PAS domain S-box-containing protein